MGKDAGLDSILRSTLSQIDAQMDAINLEFKMENHINGSSVYMMRDRSGNYLLTPLLLARSQVLLAMAMNQ